MPAKANSPHATNVNVQCDACGDQFSISREADELAREQLKRQFPGYVPEVCQVFCQDCFKLIMFEMCEQGETRH